MALAPPPRAPKPQLSDFGLTCMPKEATTPALSLLRACVHQVHRPEAPVPHCWPAATRPTFRSEVEASFPNCPAYLSAQKRQGSPCLADWALGSRSPFWIFPYAFGISVPLAGQSFLSCAGGPCLLQVLPGRGKRVWPSPLESGSVPRVGLGGGIRHLRAGGRDSLTLDILEMDHIQTFANSGHIHLRLRECCELRRRGRRPCHDSDEEGARFYGCDPREGDHSRRVDTFPALAAPCFTLLVSGIEPEILVAFDAATPDNGWPPCSKF